MVSEQSDNNDFSDVFTESEQKLSGFGNVETADENVIPVSYENVEESLLGIFIQDDESAMLITQSGLREEHFLKRKNKLLYPIVMNIRFNRGTCNYDLIADEAMKKTLPNGDSVLDVIGGLKELTRVLNAPVALDLPTTEGYIKLVFERYRLSKVQETGRLFNQLNTFDETKIVDHLSKLQGIMAEEAINRHGLVGLDNLVSDAYERFVDRKKNPQNYIGISTGFYYLDKYKAVAKRRTTVIGARTSNGKSIMVCNMVTRMIDNGSHVLVFSPELDKEEYIDRILCAEADVPIDDWKEARITESELKRIVTVQRKMLATASNNLYVEDRGIQTCSFILNSIQRHMINHQVDVVVVDYLQKMKYYGNDTKKAITEIVGNFFSFAKDHNIALILVSQLRRSNDPEPQLYDLKESGDIENFADCVILLHRNSITKIKEREEGWYKVAKNRQGPTTDAVRLKFDELCLKFKEVDAPAVGQVSDPKRIISNDDEKIVSTETMTDSELEKIVPSVEAGV